MGATDQAIVIIGGGPAGAAAALTLLTYTKRPVTLVERSDYTQVRVGETIPPSVQPLLGYLGVWELFLKQAHLPAYGSRAAWGSSTLEARSFMLTGRGEGWHLDRRRFDRMLADEVVRRGGTLLTETQWITSTMGTDGWEITLQPSAGRQTTLTAAYVIDASGHSAALARSLGAVPKVYDRLVGVTGFVSAPNGDQQPHLTLVETCPDGWWYSALLPDGRMVVTLMTDAELIRTEELDQVDPWQERLAATTHTRTFLAGATLSLPLHLRPAYSRVLDQAGGQGWVAAGDAVSSFDPIASMGIGHALLSGSHAARVAHNALGGDGQLLNSYQAHVADNFAQYTQLRRAQYLLEQQWPDSPFWRRRHQSSDVDESWAPDGHRPYSR